MSLVTNRRSFLQTSAAAGLGYWVAGGVQAQESTSPNEKIQIGCVGVGGKGKSDVQNVSRFGKVVALCDVDAPTLEGMASAVKSEHNYADFREMLDQMGDKIDAVTVSVPDHNHAVVAAKAMKMGKHVY
jgi:predicted dehydrogenase